MKISGIGSTRSAAAARRSERAKEGGTAGFSIAVEGTGENRAVGGSQAVNAAGALPAVQEVPDALDEKRQALRRGGDLLDQLEEIRVALLVGRLPRTTLERLSAMVSDRRGTVNDPNLAAILDEIELRAAVELAKLDH